MSDLQFFVEQRVLDGGVKIVFVRGKNLNNQGRSEEFESYRAEELKRIYEQYKDVDLHDDPVLEGFNILHDNFGIKRRKNIGASENLIKNLKKGEGSLYEINTCVDIYNLLSMETGLSLGAHDTDHVEGNITLRLTDGTERFQPLGQPEPIAINAGEYCYCDDSNEVLCRCEIRQVAKTAFTEESKNVFFIVQGNQATSDDDVINCAKKLIEMEEKYCGGTYELIIPTII